MSDLSGDNVIQPFQLESCSLRGRGARMGRVLDEILSSHEYPEVVAHLLGEAVTLSLLLSSMLKYEGIFTFQAQGDGPVSSIVSDITSNGAVRGCANFNEERLFKVTGQIKGMRARESAQNHLAQYLGKGYLAFTVDQGPDTERYQGLVELKGSSMVDCVQHYFNQSEQIGTGIKMAVGRRDGHWRSGAVMLQHMPEDGHNAQAGIGNVDEDSWRRAMILMDSCTEDELLDAKLSCNDILFRLFHEEGVRVFEPVDVSKGCRCSESKVENILMMMTERDRRDMSVDGRIVMTCEFCNHDFVFDPKQIDRKIKESIQTDT